MHKKKNELIKLNRDEGLKKDLASSLPIRNDFHHAKCRCKEEKEGGKGKSQKEMNCALKVANG